MKTKTSKLIFVAFLIASIAALFVITPTECTKSGSVPKHCVD